MEGEEDSGRRKGVKEKSGGGDKKDKEEDMVPTY